jgi:hypothetical protein
MAATAMAAAAVTGACGAGTGDLTILSTKDGTEVTPAFTTTIFTHSDANTVDAFLTDLPVDRLLNPNDSLADLSGSIVHVHLFLMPKAGRTPIDDAACNSTIRHMIIAQGAMGLYGGGGFLYPSSDADDDTFHATLEDASLRLVRKGPGFADRLGAAKEIGSFNAQRDDARTRALQARFGRMTDALSEVK